MLRAWCLLLLLCASGSPFVSCNKQPSLNQKVLGLRVPLPGPGGDSAVLNAAYVKAAQGGQKAPPPSVKVRTTFSAGPLEVESSLMITPSSTGDAAPAHVTAASRRSMLHIKPGRMAASNSTASVRRLLEVPATATDPTDTPITYHSGPVMSTGLKVYMIYVGYKPNDATARWLNHLVAYLGNTRWWNVMHRYPSSAANMTAKPVYAGATYIQRTKPAFITDDTVATTVVGNIVQQASAQQLVPKDPVNGVYVVVTAPGSGLKPAFGSNVCSQSCGWHYYTASGLRTVFVPGGCDNCGSGDFTNGGASSPTGDTTLDGMTDTLAHELAEVATDPFLDAWYDEAGQENADKCTSVYGTPVTRQIHGSQTTYNQIVGGYPYLLQLMYDPSLRPGSSRQVGCIYGSKQ